VTEQTALDPAILGRLVPNIPGHIMFAKVWGSHSHGTAVPESDVDYLGVYIAPNENLLGLDRAPDTLTGEKPDYQCHEVGKFADLLMKGNPGIVEMLFTDRMFISCEAWDLLAKERRRFLCKRAVAQYLGYCQGQLKKLANGTYLGTKGGDYNTKWAYHMIRLANDARRIAVGDEPKVWKEGAELDELMSIRRGEWSKERVGKHTLGLIHELESLKPWVIPDEPDKMFLNDWLLWSRGLKR